MELVKINNQPVMPLFEEEESSSDAFIGANTKAVTLDHLKTDCIIPVFTKDNESIISHQDFVQVTEEVVRSYFNRERVLQPAIRVSHEIKGRVPEAAGKPADRLLPEEVTRYWERIAFNIEVPSIQENVCGNDLSLSIGGVRALNHENLYGRKTEERFKIFVGFKNKVCVNLCVSTDGYKDDLRVRTVGELYGKIFELLNTFNAARNLNEMKQLSNYNLAEYQFAQILGRARMYQFLPSEIRKTVPAFPLSDTQVNIVAKEYFNDAHFKCATDGSLNLWRMYNLLTGANKSSYLDNFLLRSTQCTSFISLLKSALEHKANFWYLN